MPFDAIQFSSMQFNAIVSASACRNQTGRMYLNASVTFDMYTSPPPLLGTTVSATNVRCIPQSIKIN